MAKAKPAKSFYITRMNEDSFFASPKRGKFTKEKEKKSPCSCGNPSCTLYPPTIESATLTGAGRKTEFCSEMGDALRNLGVKLKDGEAIRVTIRRLK